MSKSKKLTLTIARILAERVREKLFKTSHAVADEKKAKILSSKEYKNFEKLRQQERDIRAKIKEAGEKLAEKNSTPLMKVSMNTMYLDRPSTVNITENKNVSVEFIRDTILLKEHFADSIISHDDIVNELVKEFLTA